MAYVDLHDLACRDAQIVQNLYLDEWFPSLDDGSRGFNPSAFYLSAGRALFLNGRHRAIVLSNHLTSFPMLFGQSPFVLRDKPEQALNDAALSAIVERPLSEEEFVVLPDLPIRGTIP